MPNNRLIRLETRPRQEKTRNRVRTSMMERLQVTRDGKKHTFVSYASRGSWHDDRRDDRSYDR